MEKKMAGGPKQQNATRVSESRIDSAVEATFPASDPPAIGGATRVGENPAERDDRHNRVRHRAYQLWEQAGAPDGHTDEYWHRAEADTAEARRGASSVGNDQK
ncbi:DUF2934 domain-containing protein [Paraburkholderia sp. SIMBA_009]|nr:DUF2934 domain-containing protein [Paraburkholderia tropica]